jgi:hypothetical protein
MDLLDILFSSFHGLARYPLYIILWTCSILSSKSMKWCKNDIEQVHEKMERGYRASPWNDVKMISSKSMKCTSFHGFARYPLYIISWICSISSLHHFMDFLDILFTSFHWLTRYGYRGKPWNDVKRISSKSMKWCKENIEQVHEMM